MRLVHHLFVLVFAVSQIAWIILPEQALVLRMGVSENPPMSSYADGQAQGFVIDLLKAAGMTPVANDPLLGDDFDI
ncbi:MAG: transporter substrate-binding domain-containing protein [Chloroflexi bacterium]|nr:transporter substrate-binding domain-containing protein [Chloroflexota bacterium]